MKEKFLLSKLDKRAIAGAALSILALVGCNTNTHSQTQAKPNTTQAQDPAQKLEARANQLWDDATLELRQKVDSHQRVTLNIDKGVCIYWKASLNGIYTVVRNPALYHYKKGSEELDFLPFVPSDPKTPVIMNGPYTYSDPVKRIEAFGNINGVKFPSDAQLFQPFSSIFEVQQESTPSPYSAAWLRASDGTKISETKLVEEKNLSSTFADTCHLQQPPTQAI